MNSRKRLSRLSVVALAMGCLLAACDEDVQLGRAVPTAAPPSFVGPPDGGFVIDAATPGPCDGKVCGDRCTHPDTGIQTLTRCNHDGECVGAASLSCDGG